MRLKETSIHANLFPGRPRGGAMTYATEDANEGNSSGFVDREKQPPVSSDAVATADGGSSDNDGSNGAMIDEEKKRRLESEGNIILVDWDGPDDPENPLNWSRKKKWINTVLLNLMCLFIGLATAAYSSGISDMVEEFGTSTEIGEVGLLLFNGAFAIIPLFFGPLAEFLGSNPVYLVSMAFFVIWFIGLALAPNIGAMLVFRFLSGCAGASGVTLIPGTLSNIWDTNERAIPIALFSLVAVLGTVAAPLYCGFIDQNKGWRWIEWVQLICNGAVFILLLAFLRENRGSVLLTRRAKKLRKETGDDRYRSAAEVETPSLKALLHASTTKAALLLIREPVVLSFSLWLAFAWSLVFASFTLIPLVYGSDGFGWSEGVTGLAYIGPIIGCFIAFGMSFYWKKLYDEAQAKNGGVAVPEARLYGGACGGILCTVGLLIVSFTSYNYLFWFGPQVGLALLLCGIYQVFESVQAYLADSYLENSSSAIGAQGFVRNLMAASFPLFSSQLFDRLHVWGGGLLLSMLLLIAVPLPFILIKYGARIRQRSPYAAASTGANANMPTSTRGSADGKGNGGDVDVEANNTAAGGGRGDLRLTSPVLGARRSRKFLPHSHSQVVNNNEKGTQSQNSSGPQTRVPSPEPETESGSDLNKLEAEGKK